MLKFICLNVMCHKGIWRSGGIVPCSVYSLGETPVQRPYNVQVYVKLSKRYRVHLGKMGRKLLYVPLFKFYKCDHHV
jgi:hypothetical protein